MIELDVQADVLHSPTAEATKPTVAGINKGICSLRFDTITSTQDVIRRATQLLTWRLRRVVNRDLESCNLSRGDSEGWTNTRECLPTSHKEEAIASTRKMTKLGAGNGQHEVDIARQRKIANTTHALIFMEGHYH